MRTICNHRVVLTPGSAELDCPLGVLAFCCECVVSKSPNTSSPCAPKRRDKDSFEKSVAMKSELEHFKKLAVQTTNELEKKDKEHFEKSTFSASEIDSLHLRLKQLQEAFEKAEKEAFESTTTLKAEVDGWRSKYEQLQADAKQSENTAYERQLATNAQVALGAVFAPRAVADPQRPALTHAAGFLHRGGRPKGLSHSLVCSQVPVEGESRMSASVVHTVQVLAL